jgi:hypothetical protein
MYIFLIVFIDESMLVFSADRGENPTNYC